jgi:hypothetical protein
MFKRYKVIGHYTGSGRKIKLKFKTLEEAMWKGYREWSDGDLLIDSVITPSGAWDLPDILGYWRKRGWMG